MSDLFGLCAPTALPPGQLKRIEHSVVFDTVRETGDTHFVHGASATFWKGSLYLSFAFNEHSENSISEQLLFMRSDDLGASWTRPARFSAEDGHAHSHGVLWPDSDGLLCFAPVFDGLGERPVNAKGHKSICFQNLKTELLRFDGEKWTGIGIVAKDFWPLGQPVPAGENLILSGCDGKWYAAAARSLNGDHTAFQVTKPGTDGEIFTEAAAWALGDEICLVMRNETKRVNGLFNAAVALSRDGGLRFEECVLSDLPLCTTKPFCGRLRDGRPYLIFNEALPDAPRDRGRLLLGVGNDPKRFTVDRTYLIDEGRMTEKGRRLALAYPYACEKDGRLYIFYSCESAPSRGANNNDIALTVVETAEL